MMGAILHQVHQPYRPRLLAAEREARMQVQDADRPGCARFAHWAGSSASQASMATSASGSSIVGAWPTPATSTSRARGSRSEEHTSELQSLMRTSYAVFCLKKKTTQNENNNQAERISYHNKQSYNYNHKVNKKQTTNVQTKSKHMLSEKLKQ